MLFQRFTAPASGRRGVTAVLAAGALALAGLGLPAHAQQLGGPGAAHERAPHPERPDIEMGLIEPRFHERIGPEARQALHEAHQALLARDFERAEEALARADDLIEREPPRVERALERAEEALDRGDLQAARQALLEAQQAAAAPGVRAPVQPGVAEFERPEPTAAPWRAEPFERERFEARIDPQVRQALEDARMAAAQGDLDRAERALEAIVRSKIPAILRPEDLERPWYARLGIRGYTQFRYSETLSGDKDLVVYWPDRSVGPDTSFLIRRARLILFGNITEHLYLFLQPEFASTPAGSTTTHFAQVRDWYGDIFFDKKREFRLRIGQSVVPARQRGRYQGYIGAVFAVATLAGPLVGGVLVDALSWRWVFYVNIPLGLIALVATHRYLHISHERRRAKVDYLGALLVATGIVGIVLVGVWGGQEYEWTSPVILSLASMALVCIVLLIPVERRARAGVRLHRPRRDAARLLALHGGGGRAGGRRTGRRRLPLTGKMCPWRSSRSSPRM
jgi:tetratricopeptide (TPR) repeat protein